MAIHPEFRVGGVGDVCDVGGRRVPLVVPLFLPPILDAEVHGNDDDSEEAESADDG